MIITDFEQLKPFKNGTGIYLFTNKIYNSKRYAGKSFRRLYKRIAYEHKNSTTKQYIDYAIKDLGGLLENFIIEIIYIPEEEITNNILLFLETSCIHEFKTHVSQGGYNICYFSNDRTGIPLTQETKRKQSEALKGENSPFFGIPKSKEQIQKSQETKKKNGVDFNGKNNPFFNKTHTHKMCKHLSKIRIERKLAKGKNNGRFDKNIYHFKNIKTNEEFIGYQYDFYTKYNLNKGNVGGLIKRKNNIVKGWILIKD